MSTYEAPELFVSDIHGEYEEFSHIMRSACGSIKRHIDAAFGALSEDERAELATLIYYPEEKLAEHAEDTQWISRMFERLLVLTPEAAAEASADSVLELCEAIKKNSIARVHCIGDIYDRGPSPDLVMDELMALTSVDIQWGNHDILWMGAALGQRGCVATVVRICARYGNLDVLEDVYGIDLSELRAFALETYKDDPCVAFGLKGSPDLSPEETEATVKIQKAMAFIQWKVEAQTIDENPSFGLEDRKLLHRINQAEGTVEIEGNIYPMVDTVFPTLDAENSYALTAEEARIIDNLVEAFLSCERLQKHIAFFIESGSLYKIVDGDTLLLHACVPLNEDGSLMEVELFGETLKGKSLYDAVDSYVRAAYAAEDPAEKKKGLDMLWYLWLGSGSPLFAKTKMATFELYFCEDKAIRKEKKNAFYSLLENEDAINGILQDFCLDPAASRIICGHTPVKVKDGEDPVKCGGKVVIIDGGMSKPYQKSSGIAGFTMTRDSNGFTLYSHETFVGTQVAIAENADLISHARAL